MEMYQMADMAVQSFDLARRDVKGVEGRPAPLELTQGNTVDGCLVVACPHSGRFYPPEMLSLSRLDPFSLRRSEDAYVDLLFADAPRFSADLLVSQYARAYVDLNRCESELDPLLINDIPYHAAVKQTDRVKAGLGVIPRTVGDNMNIYDAPLSMAAARERISAVHKPWHSAIETCMAQARARCGVAILLDCHSMPMQAAGDPAVDIVLGDRFGSSCAPALMNAAFGCLRDAGLSVARNDPYAGGYSTIRHSNDSLGYHALQIEINRSLYMVEGALTQRTNFKQISDIMGKLVACLALTSKSLRSYALSPA
jgi:N-formylglutamate amidohydrolase